MKAPSQLLAALVLGLAIGVLQGQQPVKSYGIHGRVLNSQTGAPIERVLIALQDNELRMALTDRDGRFEIEGLHTEPAQLRMAKRGFFLPGETDQASLVNMVVEVNSHTDSVTLKLSPASSIHGRITSEQGEAIETVPVVLFYQGPVKGAETLLRQNATTTNEDGEFNFSELPAGKYFILAGPIPGTPLMPVAHSKIPVASYGAAYYPGVSDPHASTAIALRPGQDISIDLSLKKISLFTLSGEVMGWHAGQDGSLQIFPASGAYSNYDAKFDTAAGQFHASQLPPGIYTIRVFVKDSLVAQQEINVRSSIAGLKMPLSEPRRIAVTVHAKDRRAENAYVSVKLEPEDKWQQPILGFSRPEFMLEPAPGKYWAHFSLIPPLQVIAANCGATDLLREPLIVTDQNVPDIDLTVAYDSATLGGQVHSQGLPVAAHVLIVPVDPPGEPRVQATNLEGDFAGLQLAPGRYHVWAFDKLPRRYRNAATLEPYDSSAKIITLTADQKTDLTLEIVTVKADDANE
jgi:hypothetical protein